MDYEAQLLPSENQALVDLLKGAAQRVGTRAHVNLLAEVTALTRNTLDSLRIPDALSDLPLEVLVHILSFLPFASLVRVSATCRTFRRTILEDAVLWNNVVTSSSQDNAALRLFLERGRSVPVSLDITVNRPQSDLVDLFTAHIWRMSRLVISTHLMYEDFPALRLLPVAIARPAPHLRYFELRLRFATVRGPFFASHAPVLEQLWICARFQLQFSVFPTLRVVVLSGMHNHSFRYVWHIMDCCPALEHMAIRAHQSPEDQPDRRALPLLPALRSLRFRVDYANEDVSALQADFLLRVVRPDVRARIDLALMPLVSRNDVPLGAEVLFVGRHPDDTPRFNIHARGAGRPSRTFRGVSLPNARAALHEQLVFSAGRLQQLTVPASLLAVLALPDGTAFPRLHTCTVSLRERDDVFAEHGRHLHLARMPALRTLVLRREMAAAICAWDVLLDADALRACLAVPGNPRIARLVLQGVHVGNDVHIPVTEVVREPWQYDVPPVFERMDWWVFDDSRL